MTPHQDWRTSLSFSDRFAVLSEITSAYQAAHATSSITDARQYAKTIEEELRAEASSLKEYRDRCNACISTLQAPSQSDNQEDQIDQPDDDFDNPNVPKLEIGPYKDAAYYRNGITSMVYKVRATMSQAVLTQTTSRYLALKVAELAAMEPPHNVQREVRILRRAASAHVIPLLETFQSKQGHLVLVMPFMRFELPSLLSEGQKFTHVQRVGCLENLLSAVAYLHSLGIIHRDIKPGNILLASATGPAYLADFGIAWDPLDPASESAGAKITDVGTTCYRAPELLFGNTAYGPATDLWAVGCVIAEVVDQSIDTLFDAGDVGSDLTLISNMFKKLGTPTLQTWPEAVGFSDWGKFDFHMFPTKAWKEILPSSSEAGRELVASLVVYESSERLSASEALKQSLFTVLHKAE